jgi:hypothetical protein
MSVTVTLTGQARNTGSFSTMLGSQTERSNASGARSTSPEGANNSIDDTACDKETESSSVDSGYASQASSRELTVDIELNGLAPFEKSIPQTALDCAKDWKLLFRGQLRDIFVKSNASGSDFLMPRLRYLGTSETDAKLYLVFQCHPKLATPLRKFLRRKHVQDQRKSQFEFLVVAQPPRRIRGESVYPQNVNRSIGSDPLDCANGTKIVARRSDGTFYVGIVGGTLLITASDQTRLLVMTAGHVISVIYGKTSAVELFEDANDLHLDEEHGKPWEMYRPEHLQKRMGTVVRTSADPTGAGKSNSTPRPLPDLDWALIELETPWMAPPNVICHAGRELALQQPLHTAPKITQASVLVITEHDKYLSGQLLIDQADLIFSGSNQFTTMHQLILDSKLDRAYYGEPKSSYLLA